jgi:peptide/nickel transport system permease protein
MTIQPADIGVDATVEGMTGPARPVPSTGLRSRIHRRPLLWFVIRRVLLGLVTLVVVSIVIFAATELLPGNAAQAILGLSATPARLHVMEAQLHLNQPVYTEYWDWFSGVLSGNLGHSLVNGRTVSSLLGDRIVNSLTLVLLAGGIGTLIAISIALYSALHRGRVFDETLGVFTLAFAALPEFVIAIGLVIIFATVVFHILPAVSIIPPGETSWSLPKLLILPVVTLILATIPYTIRMLRASAIEVLESEYVAMARLKGLTSRRILLRHVIPNALPSTVQVIALVFSWLAGGVVLVEYVFNYPGLGQAFVDAVSNRDVPVVQALALILAGFYVLTNLCADLAAVLLSARTRTSLQ